MRQFFEGMKLWYLRRFRGYVAPPRTAGGHGTKWQQHKPDTIGFTCPCGMVIAFSTKDLFVRTRDHVESCPNINSCDCPVTSARYCKVCPTCKRGHWKDASPKRGSHGSAERN